jgi:hypothetical protein
MLQEVRSNPGAAPATRSLFAGPVELDRRLPAWARRSNPVVRRHLGLFWKTILPEMGFLLRIYAAQAALIALSLPIPFLIDLLAPTITATILLLPFALVMYVQTLVMIGYQAAVMMTAEIQADNLTLLRVTPLSLRSILGSQVAAVIWRQVENLGLLIVAAGLLTLPILITVYAQKWPLETYPLASRLAMIAGLGVAMLRLVIEPFLVGVIGTACGAVFKQRSPAVLATFLFMLVYFVGINLPRLIPLSPLPGFLVEFALPLVAPLAIIALCFTFCRRLLERD